MVKSVTLITWVQALWWCPLSVILLTSCVELSHPFTLQTTLQHYPSSKPPSATIHQWRTPYGSTTRSGMSLTASSSSSAEDREVMAMADEGRLQEYAATKGITVSLTTLGPGYRAVARATHDPEQILGYCEGFVRPGGKVLHVDKLEVWKKAIAKATSTLPPPTPTSTNTTTTTPFQKSAGTTFGISLLLGYICLLHGRSSGCAKAEFLAIDDEAFQHKRLVRFFSRAGFRVIRYVGEGLGDVPDRLVWGGCGTLMERDIEGLLMEWTKIIFRER